MYQICYTSFIRDDLKASDIIEDIKKSAQINNIREKITGKLIYSDTVFVQLIEGQKDKVEGLFETIKSDDRHQKVKLLFEQYSNQRTFGRWSMKFNFVDQISLKQINKVLELNHIASKESLGKADIIKIFKEFEETL